jgi:glycosyltransferase involved in cell wall biosynthesis
MKKVLILSNHHVYTYNLRKEIIQKILYENYEVYLVLPYGEKVERLMEIGCKFIDLPLDRRGINPINDLKLLFSYYRIIKKIKPSVVLSYTIKPNIYGGIASKSTNTPYLANVTGIGTSINNKGLIQKITLTLYKFGLKKAACVFFQNELNRQLFIDKHIVNGKTKLIPGSGVNLNYHCFEDYPDSDDIIKFLFIGRIMKDKGIDELLEAAQKIKGMYPNVQFDLVGYCEENYTKRLSDFENRGIIKYHGQQNEDGSTFNSEDDPRLTKIGKFIRKTSLDETPQLLNIIKGDMSIIGPRPDLPEHRELYEENEERKLEVRPGVSGYNQAYFRNTVPWKERIQHDIYYIDHLSLRLDIKIFFKTAVSVLKREDIYVVPANSIEMAASIEDHVESDKNVGIGM